MLRKAILLALALAPVSAFATGGFYCYTADKSFSVDANMGHFPHGMPFTRALQVQLAGEKWDIPANQINGFWYRGPRLWLDVNADPEVMKEPTPSFVIKTIDNGKRQAGKVAIEYKGTKVVKDISCDLG